MKGWKTWVGAAFGAFTIFLTGAKDLIDPEVYKWLLAASGALGVFLTSVGIAHKVEKAGTK